MLCRGLAARDCLSGGVLGWAGGVFESPVTLGGESEGTELSKELEEEEEPES